MLPFNTEPALEGDYILLRFSSLLPQISCCKRNTSQYNNSSIKENQSLLMPSLIPGDSSAILPVIIPTANFRGWASPTQPLLDMVGIEEVECLTPSSGGPAAGQCQFACISTALSDSLTSLDNNSRLDLELRRLALRIIETNPTMYQDFLTTVRVSCVLFDNIYVVVHNNGFCKLLFQGWLSHEIEKSSWRTVCGY